MKVFFRLVVLLLALSLAACGSDKDDKEEGSKPDVGATQTMTAVQSTISAMPQATKLLYLGISGAISDEFGLIQNASEQQYLYGETRTMEWNYTLDDTPLTDSYRYDLLMASGGTTGVDIELSLKQGDETTSLGTTHFDIETDMYSHFTGEFAGVDVEVHAGDQLVFTLVAAGGDFGIGYGLDGSQLSLLKADYPAELIAERNRALSWMVLNTLNGSNSDVVNNFRTALDNALAMDLNAEWKIGWGLTLDKKPYTLKWTDQVFSVEELTQAQAEEAGVGEMDVQRALTERGAATETPPTEEAAQ